MEIYNWRCSHKSGILEMRTIRFQAQLDLFLWGGLIQLKTIHNFSKELIFINFLFTQGCKFAKERLKKVL